MSMARGGHTKRAGWTFCRIKRQCLWGSTTVQNPAPNSVDAHLPKTYTAGVQMNHYALLLLHTVLVTCWTSVHFMRQHTRKVHSRCKTESMHATPCTNDLHWQVYTGPQLAARAGPRKGSQLCNCCPCQAEIALSGFMHAVGQARATSTCSPITFVPSQLHPPQKPISPPPPTHPQSELPPPLC
jgi:hypothetical protein